MDHFEKIYASKAQEYHQLIIPEDVEGNFLPALRGIAPFEKAVLLDLGSGTGRIPLLVKDIVNKVIALDLNFPMLVEQEKQQQLANISWPLIQGDNRTLPLKNNWASVVTAGWALGHLRGWYDADWRTQIGRILTEMERAAVPGGWLIIIETLTTGALEPAPPTPELTEYYAWLEETWGYTRHAVQTDYQFASVEDAVAKTEFFFGPDLVKLIRQNNWARLPEWTGVWYKQI